MQKKSTAKGDVSVGLRGTLEALFAGSLQANGLNLDGNPRKKRVLTDFCLCISENAEAVMKKIYTRDLFHDSGITDEDHHMFTSFDGCMSTCKRWVSSNSDIGLSKAMKDHIKKQIPALLNIQLEFGQVSSADMNRLGIPRGEFKP